MFHCQTFKQKIEELKGKVQSLEAFLLNYIETGDERIVQQFERELEVIIQKIEEFKEEFKNKATQLIEEFIQRRDNKDDRVEIILDETDFRFIIDGNLEFDSRTHLNDFPNLIKELQGSLSARRVQTLDPPKLRKAKDIYADHAQTINLPNLEEVLNILAYEALTLDLPKLRKAGDISANNAPTINLPNLEEVNNIYAPQALTLDLPKLRKAAGNIYFVNTPTINLPNLEKAIHILAYQAQTINLPNIRELGNIYFYENNPNLESLLNQAREWRTRGILKGKIWLVDENGYRVREL